MDAPVADRLLVRRHPAAHRLGEAAGEDAEQPEDQEGARVGRRREDRRDEGSLGREDHLDHLADPLVDVQLGGPLGRVGEVAEDAGDPLPEEESVGVVAGVVDRAQRLGTGAGQVADDLARRLGHGHPEHVQSRLGDAIVLDVVLEAVAAVRDLGEDLAPEGLRAAVDHRLEAGLDGLRAVLGEKRRQPAGAHPAGGDLAVEVAREGLRGARVADDDAVEVVVPDPPVEEPHGRDQQALLVGAGRVRRHRAGHHAADVVVVAEGLDEGDHPSLVEDGHRRGEVGQVADRALREVDVVVIEDVALPHRREREVADDGLDHRAVGAAGQLPAAGVVDAGPVVVLVADHGRARGPLDRRLHLRLDRGQGALDDLQHYGIDRGDHRRSTRLAKRSTSKLKPLSTTVVEPYSSMIAGPSALNPAGRSARWKTM